MFSAKLFVILIKFFFSNSGVDVVENFCAVQFSFILVVFSCVVPGNKMVFVNLLWVCAFGSEALPIYLFT